MRDVSASAEAAGAPTAQAIGTDLVGVDLIAVPLGHLVIELNAAVDFDRTYSTAGPRCIPRRRRRARAE